MGKSNEADQQREATGNLSDKLARSAGVICPPAHVDPEIRQPARRAVRCLSFGRQEAGRRPVHPAEVTALEPISHFT
jgi:hypothetical protein